MTTYEAKAKEWLEKEYRILSEFSVEQIAVCNFARFLDSQSKPQEAQGKCLCKLCPSNDSSVCASCPCHQKEAEKPIYALTPFTQETVDAMKKLNEKPVDKCEHEWREPSSNQLLCDKCGSVKFKNTKPTPERIEKVQWVLVGEYDTPLNRAVADKLNELVDSLNHINDHE